MSTNYQIPISYVVQATGVPASAGLEPLQMGTILLLTDSSPTGDLSGSYMIARNATAVGQMFGTTTEVFQQAQIVFAQNPNILTAGGYLIVAPFTSTSETYSQAITRLSQEIYFEGVITTRAVKDENAVEASATVQAMQNCILFLPASRTEALTTGTGLFDQTKANSFTKNLLYTFGTDTTAQALNARLFAAAYASRGLSVNYSGSNTTLTMNLKDLAGLQADTNINETILAQAAAVGADCFVSLEGLPKVISNANNLYFDQVANQIWLVNAVQRAVFNVLATTRTKIPQTTAGMNLLANACKNVCLQGITNGYLAPGTWNSSDTFGDLEDFYRNIEEQGFYIYYQPISQQAQAEREQRIAPVIQIAAKEAGAIQSANIIITLEA